MITNWSNDIYGTATAGFRNRRAVFRDPGIRAWYDYLAWSNPQVHDRPAHVGRATVIADSDVLVDTDTDFTKLPLDEMGTLHIQFGGHLAGVKTPEPDPALGDPNFGVYQIVDVLGPHRIRVTPAPLQSGKSVYSIGRRTYGKFRQANCEFYLLDTRSHRDLHDVNTPAAPGRSMLGPKQLAWLIDSMQQSDADFFFIASTVNFMVPHIGSGGSGWIRTRRRRKMTHGTVFLDEREKLIKFWSDEIKRPVFVMTGDLHSSFAIKVTDNVWEFCFRTAQLPQPSKRN